MSEIDAVPNGHAVLRSLTARLSVARQSGTLQSCAAHFEGLLCGLRIASAITAEQEDTLRHAAQTEFAMAAERLEVAAPSPEPPTALLPGLQCAHHAIHHGMSGTQARAVIADLIADQHAPAIVRAAAKAA